MRLPSVDNLACKLPSKDHFAFKIDFDIGILALSSVDHFAINAEKIGAREVRH